MPEQDNNQDLSTITGSGPHSQKTKQLHQNITQQASAAIENERQQTQQTPAPTGDFQLPAGYDPMYDPKVKQSRDSLLSKIAGLKEQFETKEAEFTKVAQELNLIKEAQEKERLAKLSDTEKFQDQLSKLADQNKELLQKLADAEVARQAKEFEVAKVQILKESGIPEEYHKFIGADKKDADAFQLAVEEAKEVFKDVIKKSQVPGQIQTQQMGAPNPPAADSDAQKATQQAPAGGSTGGSILEKLTPEQAQSINLETLPELIKNSPKLQNALTKVLNR